MRRNILVITSLSLLALFVGRVAAQPAHQGVDSLLQAGRFAEALPVLQQLHAQYPDSADISCSLAACHIYATRNYKRAEELLAPIAEGRSRAQFFLGEVFRLTYRFEQAAAAYQAAEGYAGEAHAAQCDNGANMTRYVYKPNVVDVKRVGASVSHQYYSLAPKHGSFLAVPANLLTDVDRQRNHQPLMFYPKSPQEGDVVYFSSYGSTGANGKDIYRTQMLADGRWSAPELLPMPVNTAFDEDFPYPSPDGKCLYFASNSNYGMGGYDIYRAKAKSASNYWETPENMGFPFNSPADDYLLVPTIIDSLVLLSTNRNVAVDSAQVVLMVMKENQVMRYADSPEQVAALATLARTAQPKAVASAVAKKTTKKAPQRAKSASFSAVENDPEYSRTIAKGFEAQMQADTLREKLEKLREKFADVETAEQRIALEKRVYNVEERMLSAQKQADQLFLKASRIEQEYLTGKRKPAGKAATSTFSSDNPTYIYQAQFASTVFQEAELKQLAKAEELHPELVKLRKRGLSQRDAYSDCLEQGGDCQQAYAAMIAAMQQYSARLERYFEQKYAIYNECMPVAIVKSGVYDDGIREVSATATSHFRAASTIVNHLADEGRDESLFEANLLRELGLLRMDYVFAKVWGMSLMENKLAQRIAQFDTELFGSSTINTAADEPVVAVNLPRIERSSDDVSAVGMAVKSTIPDDFGVVDTMVYSDSNPIPIIKHQPKGVVYRIQIGAFGTPRQPKFFKNMVPVVGVKAGQVTKYYIGCLRRYEDAEKALKTVKERGFKDAFIVAWYNGNTVAINRAKQLENEVVKPVLAADEADATQVYAVQIAGYQVPMPTEELKTVKALSAGREVSRRVNDQGEYIYSVGSFKTKADAEKLKGNLIASGLQNVEVISIDL